MKFARFCLSLVVVLSVVACSKDKKDPGLDVYKPTVPTVKSDGNSFSLIEFDLKPDRSVNIDGAVNFHAEETARTAVESNCTFNSKEYKSSQVIIGVGDTPYLQLIPEELLINDFSKNPLECTFQVFKWNSNKARNNQTITSIRFFDRGGKDSLEVKREKQSVSRDFDLNNAGSPYRMDQLDGVRLRQTFGDATHAKIMCSDFEVARMTFDKMIELDNFDFSKPLIVGEKNFQILPITLQLRPLQTCRALAYKNDKLVGMSRFFDLKFPRAKVSVEVSSDYPNVIPARYAELRARADDVLRGRAQELYPLHITNNSSVDKTIRIAKLSLGANITFLRSVNEGESIQANTLSGQWLTLYPGNIKTENINITPEGTYIIKIAANEKITLNYVLIPPNRRLGCNSHIGDPVAFIIKPQGSVEIEELLNPDQRVYDKYSFPVTAITNLSFMNLPNTLALLDLRKQAGEAQDCGW